MGWRDSIKKEESGVSPATSSWRSTIKKEAPERSLVGEGLAKLDAYTGVPSRAAVSALAKGKGLVQAGKDFADYYGTDPSLAPSARDVKEDLGLPDMYLSKMRGPIGLLAKLTESGTGYKGPELGELAIGMGADWTNLLPLTGLLKGGSKAVDAAQAAKAVDAATDLPKVASSIVDEFGRPFMVPQAAGMAKAAAPALSRADQAYSLLTSPMGKTVARSVLGGAVGYGGGGSPEDVIAGMVAGAASKYAPKAAKSVGKGLLSNKELVEAGLRSAIGSQRLSGERK